VPSCQKLPFNEAQDTRTRPAVAWDRVAPQTAVTLFPIVLYVFSVL